MEIENIQDEKTITEFSVQFGLITFREGDGEEATIKTQFLHRTFAEFLFAKYLFNAMAVNLCEYYKLLDNEAVRDLIANQILVQDNYDGVRVFIDSMLQETVHSEQWRRVIKKELELPNRLQNFAYSLANYITNPREDESFPLQSLHGNPLSLALYKANMNLFFTLFECLDRKFDKTEMSAIVRSAFDRRYFSFDFFLNFSNGEFFRRVVSYYDDADVVEVQRIVKEILYRDIYNQTTLVTLESYRFLWEKEQTKEIVKAVLDFMEKHQSILNTIWDYESNELHRNHFTLQILHFFVFNEYYDSLFNQFFDLLASVYSKDCDLIKLLTYTLRMRDANNNNWAYPSNSGIKKTLTNLRDLGRYKVMQGLSHLALVSDKKVFDEFYQPCRPNKGEAFQFQLLLEKDSSGMTCLHRAAFYRDTNSVNEILEIIHTSFSSIQHHATTKELVDSVVRGINLAIPCTCERFTPFYVAAACGHKDICHKILSFLKEILGGDHKKDLTKNGFIYCAMWDAILLENLQMFQLVLEVVKEAWGQDSLLVLLKTENFEILYNKSCFYVFNSFADNYDKEVLKIKVKVLLRNDSKKGYEDLNDLVFVPLSSYSHRPATISHLTPMTPITVITSTDPNTYDREKVGKTLKDVEDETLRGMLCVKGLANWTKRFLNSDIDFDWAFCFLSNHLLARFTNDQRSQLVDAITSARTSKFKSYPVEISYWAEWVLDLECPADFDCLDKLLCCIRDNENNERSDIQKLLFSDNGKDITRFLLCRNQKIFSSLSKYLTSIDQLRIKKYVTENVPEIINELFQPSFQSRFSKFRLQALRYWGNILPFYDDRKEKKLFGKLAKTLVFLRTEEHGHLLVQYSFWSKYLDSPDEDGNKVEMADEFLKRVSEKLGKEAVKEVVLHKDYKGLVLLGAELQENKQLVNVLLTHLNRQDRDFVNHLIITNCPFNTRR